MSEAPAVSEQGLYGYAAGLLARGDCAAASDSFEKVIAGFPDSAFAAKAQFGLARCEARMGRPANAVRLCNELLARKAEGVDLEEVVSFQLEQIRLLSSSDPQRAAELAEAVVQGAPTASLMFDAAMQRARILLHEDRFDDARESALIAVKCATEETRRNDALLLAAMSDLIPCYAVQPSLTRMERAAGLLRQVNASGRENDTTAVAREYGSLAEIALNEADARHIRVFMAPTLLYRERMDEALDFFSRARREYKDTLAGETAAFYYGETAFRMGEYWSAFKKFQEFVRDYPASARLSQAVERQFRAGEALDARGERSRAVTVMEKVVANAPQGPLADDALMQTGRAQLAIDHSDEATVTFDRLMKDYPRSEWAAAALYFSGVAALRNSELAGDREEALAQARAAFEGYLLSDPNGPFAGDARGQLAATKERQAACLMKTSEFYARRGQPAAADEYYSLVEQGFAGTAASSEAQRLRAAEGGGKEIAP